VSPTPQRLFYFPVHHAAFGIETIHISITRSNHHLVLLHGRRRKDAAARLIRPFLLAIFQRQRGDQPVLVAKDHQVVGSGRCGNNIGIGSIGPLRFYVSILLVDAVGWPLKISCSSVVMFFNFYTCPSFSIPVPGWRSVYRMLSLRTSTIL